MAHRNLTIAAIFTAAALSGGAAFAQDATAPATGGNTAGGTVSAGGANAWQSLTCAEYSTNYETDDQTQIIDQINRSNLNGTVVSPQGIGGATSSGADTASTASSAANTTTSVQDQTSEAGSPSGGAQTGTALTAEQLAASCQANPSQTVQDAVASLRGANGSAIGPGTSSVMAPGTTSMASSQAQP